MRRAGALRQTHKRRSEDASDVETARHRADAARARRGAAGCGRANAVKVARLCRARDRSAGAKRPADRGAQRSLPGRSLLAARGRERAAAIATRDEGCISHRSAAALHDVHATAVDTVEVIMPRRRRRHIEGIRIHRARDLLPDEVTTIDGIPVTTPARTLLDISEEMPAREVEQALANALRMKLVTRD